MHRRGPQFCPFQVRTVPISLDITSSISQLRHEYLTCISGDIVGQSDGKVTDDDLVSLCKSSHCFGGPGSLMRFHVAAFPLAAEPANGRCTLDMRIMITRVHRVYGFVMCCSDSVLLGTQLAQEYGDDDNILFGLMNEPHDLDMDRWGITMQKVVDAIRKETGNNDKILLLPGTNFT